MPKGEDQKGKKRGPYKRFPEDVEIRVHPMPKEKPPRFDVRKLIVPEDDPDLNPDNKPKKNKKKKEEEKKEERISRIIATFLKKQHAL